jgi:hypothetical protein
MSDFEQGSSSSDEKRAAHGDEVLSPVMTNEQSTIVSRAGTVVNASGHRDQLKRQYGLLEICGLALTIDNAWIAFAGSLQISLLNGGPPGILYEYIVACVYYTLIALCIAELASSLPSSGGVYHWATIAAGPRYGRCLGMSDTAHHSYTTNLGMKLPRLLHRFTQLLRLDLRPREYRRDPRQCGRPDVRRLPPRLRH